jgi:hypothetical protein
MQDTLPEERGTLLGRDTEVGLVRQLVRDNRVVTLTGPGGVGKTRTAIHVARSMLGEFPGGVDFIELAPISAPEIVESAIQTHCGKRAENAFLLIVDNCEHVLQAAARTIQRAVASSKHLYVLCTSRQPLGIGAEHVFRLRPLTAPPCASSLSARLPLRQCRSAVKHRGRLSRVFAATLTVFRSRFSLPLRVPEHCRSNRLRRLLGTVFVSLRGAPAIQPLTTKTFAR